MARHTTCHDKHPLPKVQRCIIVIIVPTVLLLLCRSACMFLCAEVTDTIIGDVDSEPREQALARERNGEPAAALGQQQPQQGGGHHTSDASLAHALRAHIPKGPLAEDAAMCEPMPGDAPGRITDDELAAMRAGGAGASRYAAAKTSGTANTGSSGGVEGRGAEREGGTTATTSSSAAAEGVERGEGGSNAPADSPEHIKQVVDEETLRDAKYNEF